MGRCAVVIGVGAGAGLGAALARRFAREGLHVFLAGRTPARLESVAEAIRAEGGRATPVVADTTRTSEVVSLFDAAAAAAASPELVV
ncbi:MAG: SDR family NAD(P)-dependent oxidoreductase, partial [Myxococcales bacterium]|nr:SDR family NAD(P)-dependent oxidoreductase [Myxococcales bacterium]